MTSRRLVQPLLLCAVLLSPSLRAAAPANPTSAPTPAAGTTLPRDAPLGQPSQPTPQANPSPKTAAATRRDTWWPVADPNTYSIVGAASGLSLYKPMYIEPATYSPQYNGRRTELVFQLSFKLKLLHWPDDGGLYVGYTQKSFWQAYNAQDSRPFRETDYNPDVFYRFIPSDVTRWHHLGVDIGAEHQSNGQALPNSRSWNRIYIAPFQAAGNHLIYWKWWWRLPEKEGLPRTDPARDDNPDIEDYYGYSELDYEQRIFGQQVLHLMTRFNPHTRRGAVELQYSIPGPDNRFFWALILFNGYGDSLIDYNHSVTRIGIALMLTR